MQALQEFHREFSQMSQAKGEISDRSHSRSASASDYVTREDRSACGMRAIASGRTRTVPCRIRTSLTSWQRDYSEGLPAFATAPRKRNGGRNPGPRTSPDSGSWPDVSNGLASKSTFTVSGFIDARRAGSRPPGRRPAVLIRPYTVSPKLTVSHDRLRSWNCSSSAGALKATR